MFYAIFIRMLPHKKHSASPLHTNPWNTLDWSFIGVKSESSKSLPCIVYKLKNKPSQHHWKDNELKYHQFTIIEKGHENDLNVFKQTFWKERRTLK